MRLTQTIRDAFVNAAMNAAMNDVPREEFSEQRTQLVQAESREKLPPKVRAIYDDKELRGFLGTKYVKGVYVFAPSDYEPSAALLKKLEVLKARESAQSESHRELRNKLRAVALSVSTSKALADALPEFSKYLPKDPEAASRQVPALANVMSDFVKAGWPKDKKTDAAKRATKQSA